MIECILKTAAIVYHSEPHNSACGTLKFQYYDYDYDFYKYFSLLSNRKKLEES